MTSSSPAPAEAPRSATRPSGRALDLVLENNLLVVLVLVQCMFLLVVGRKLLGVDSWLTFAAGREIAQQGLPHHEVITVMPRGREWTDQQWLAQLVFYGLHRLGGVGLAVVVQALLITATMAVVVTASRLRGASARMTLLAATVCLLVAPWSWQLRAQSIALPLFAATLALLSTDRGLRSRRTLAVFPILVLWANVHGSVTLGAALVSLAGLFAVVRRARGQSGGAGRELLYLFVPWLCVLVSPYGTGLVGYYKLLFVDSPVSKYITEWQAPPFHGYFLAFYAVGAATVVIAVWQRRRLALYDLIVLSLTLAGACRSVRAVVWFALAMAILLPVALDGVVPPGSRAPIHRRLGAVLTGTLAILVAVLGVFTVTRSDDWFERDWPSAPARAAVLAATGTDGHTFVWSGGTLSDYLLWKDERLRGRIAWDVRFELLTEAELREIVRFNARKAGWRATLQGYPVVVLDRRESKAQIRALLGEPGTEVLFADGGTVVLRRPAGRRR